MGQPVVHFEIMGKDGAALREYYASLFGWAFDTANPMDYGTVDPKQNPTNDGRVGSIGGGVGTAPEGYDGHLTFYIAVDDVEAALARAESLGGKRLMGPFTVTEGIEIGQFADPEGHMVGLVRGSM
ncbi:MAG TPA: VOC family protein [Candidatus Dormibacteraeota bacterium]|jgi:predicted enzyme related to lactoylglutathione lyase|nr:VOC family protein [Candidatus Dormibacteraeota bacterium]